MNKTEKFWDKIAGKQDNQAIRREQTHIKTVKSTKKYLISSDVVLDYACGTGIITNDIADKVKEIHAIDISSKMIDVAKSEAGERKIENIHFAQTTISDVRYRKESFNVILAFNILHLLEDAHKVMQRINELLKPGGYFISVTPCMGEKKAFFGFLLILLSKTGIFPYLKILKLSELEDLIVHGSFQIVETENLDPTPQSYFIVAKKISRA